MAVAVNENSVFTIMHHYSLKTMRHTNCYRLLVISSQMFTSLSVAKIIPIIHTHTHKYRRSIVLLSVTSVTLKRRRDGGFSCKQFAKKWHEWQTDSDSISHK